MISSAISNSPNPKLFFKLLGFLVDGVLAAERAELSHFQTVRIVLFVLHRIVISLLALAAGKGDSFSHDILRIMIRREAVILPPKRSFHKKRPREV